MPEGNIRSKDIITPGSHKGRQCRIDDNRLGKRQNQLIHNLETCCTVNSCRLVQCLRNGVKISLAHIILHAAAGNGDQNQARNRPSLRQTKLLQQEVHADHGEEAREHAENQPAPHQERSSGKTHPRQRVGHTQNNNRLKQRNTECNDDRIAIPEQIVCLTGEQEAVVVQGKLFGNDVAHHSAVFRCIGAEALHQNSEKRKQPDDAHQNQYDIGRNVSGSSSGLHGRCFLLFRIHYWKPSSSLTDGSML